jgi:type IV pilus assembly protein PilF
MKAIGLPTAFLLLSLATSACKHGPSEKEQQNAEIHYDLGINAQQTSDMQTALAEFETALQIDPRFAQAHYALAALLHNAFGKQEDAIRHYKQALELNPSFSEAKNGLGTVYLDQGRYDEAIKLFEEALADMRYREPHIAEGNLGIALYRKGNPEQALQHLRAAITLQPKFCLGHRLLGIIASEQGNYVSACQEFARYRDSCPEVADAYYREGICLAKLGKTEPARSRFATCQEKSSNESLKGECRSLAEQLR